MNEDFTPIADTINLVANQQYADATSIVHDLLGNRVMAALETHKQSIAQNLFAPSADALAEGKEPQEKKSENKMDRELKRKASKGMTALFKHGFKTGDVKLIMKD